MKFNKKIILSTIAMGCFLVTSGLGNVAPAQALPLSTNSKACDSTGIAGRGQSNMWWQLLNRKQTNNQQQFNQRQQQQQVQPAQTSVQQPQLNSQMQVQQRLQQQCNQQEAPISGDIIAQVADILDVDEEYIWEALQNGDTLAEIAADYDLDEDELLDALEDAQTEAIEAAVDAGIITGEQADEMLDNLAERLMEIIENPLSSDGGNITEDKQILGFIGGNLISEVADILDIDKDEIIDALEDGDTLAEIAADYDMDEDDLLEALEDAQTEAIETAVSAGFLSETQADKILDNLSDTLSELINK